VSTLGDAFPAEIETAKQKARGYEEIGPAGALALILIRRTIAAAERAWAEQDTAAMVRLLPQLQDIAW
jgi:hypothetical protein